MQANQNPEQIARDRIDAQLRAAGWAVQDKSAIDFNEGEGQAVREYTTDCGPADYVLFLDRKPVGITEAKRETLRELLSQEKSLRARLMELPALIPIDLRECQIDAVNELDGSVKKAKPRSLVQMATGSGKTFTALTPFDATVRRNYRDWILKKNAGQPFTASQTAFLEMIRDHLMTSLRFERDDLDFAPFDAQGGLGKMHQLFGDGMDALIEEINGELVA